MSSPPDASAGLFGTDYAPPKMYVWTGPDQVSRSATTGDAYGKAILHDHGNLCGHDVAFLVLDRDLTGAPTAPIRLKTRP